MGFLDIIFTFTRENGEFNTLTLMWIIPLAIILFEIAFVKFMERFIK